MIIKRNLPDKVLDAIPEGKLYEKLLEQEQQIDQLINRHKFSMVEELRKGQSMKSNTKFEISVITNVKKLASNNEGAILLNHPQREMFLPSYQHPNNITVFWDIIIEGRLLDNDEIKSTPMTRRVSNHLKSLKIVADPNIYSNNSILIDWKKEIRADVNNFKMFRLGLPKSTKIDITLEVNHVPQKFKVHPKLQKLFGVEVCTKSEIITLAWNYISTNQLQDPNDHRMVKFDRHLKELTGVTSIPITELIPCFNKFLVKFDPVCFEHVIDATQIQDVIERNQILTSKTTKIIDITTENCFSDQVKEFLIRIKQNSELEKLDSEMMQVLESLRLSSRAHHFYDEFFSRPISFFREWLVAQQNDQNVIEDAVEDVGLGAENHHAETYLAREDLLNDASYFSKPWVNEAIKQYTSDLFLSKYKQNDNRNLKK